MIYYVITFVNRLFVDKKQSFLTFVVDFHKKPKKSLAFAQIKAIILDVTLMRGVLSRANSIIGGK